MKYCSDVLLSVTTGESQRLETGVIPQQPEMAPPFAERLMVCQSAARLSLKGIGCFTISRFSKFSRLF
jgi:hypothetical protein